MKIGEEKEYWGQRYTAVAYNERPADFIPNDDDAQCKICAIEPNYCKMQDECHGAVPFIFVKSIYIKAMSNLNNI